MRLCNFYRTIKHGNGGWEELNSKIEKGRYIGRKDNSWKVERKCCRERSGSTPLLTGRL